MNAIQFPLSRVTIAFIFGIYFAHTAKVNLVWAAIAVSFSFLFFCFSYFWSRKQLNPTISFGIATYSLSFFMGSFILLSHSGWNQKNNYIHQIIDFEKPHQVEVVLREKLKKTRQHDRFIAIAYSIDNKQCSGKILLNFKKDCFAEEPKIGSKITLHTTLIQHKDPLNPNQFDYGKYLETKSIMAQTYIKAGQFKINSLEKDLFYFADCLRTRLITNLEKANFRTTELNIFAALLLGQQQDISQDVVRDYQLAGAIHILSVSGLHVGFLVFLIGLVIKLLPKNKWANKVRLFATLLLLWAFAFIAGLSPSVVRSVTMFSFVALGLYLNRTTNMFHVLSVSLLVILLFEPAFLFDIGFQLSYLALFFILWLQPILSKTWTPNNRILSYFWDILTVSFAAQIGTFPISVYYFHQFPTLFFVTNLIVIPFLSIIMSLGLLLLSLSLFDFTPKFLINLVEKSINILNQLIHWVASFDEFVFTGIPLTAVMVVVMYLLTFSLVFYTVKPIYNRLRVLISCTVLLQLCYLYSKWHTKYEKEWIIFNVPKATLISQRSGEEVILFTNTPINVDFYIQPYLIANFSKVSESHEIPKLMTFKNKKIAVIDSTGYYPKGKNPDILLLRQSPKVNFERVLNSCKPKLVIADASNYRTYVKLWKSTCYKEKIPFHNTYEKGFYIIKD